MTNEQLELLEDLALAYQEAMNVLCPMRVVMNANTGEYIETIANNGKTMSTEAIDFCLRLWSDAYDEIGEWDE